MSVVTLLRDMVARMRREKLRFALSLGGVVLGAATLVFLASALSSARIALARMSQVATGANLSRVQSRNARDEIAGGTLDVHDADALQDHESLAAKDVVTGSMRMSQEATVGSVRNKVGIQSGGSEYARLAGLQLVHGRWLEPSDENERRCMIGNKAWKTFFNEKWPLGANDTITIDNGLAMQVVGVFDSHPNLGGGGDGTYQLDHKVFVSNTTFRHYFDDTGAVGEIVSRYQQPEDAPLDLRKIARRLSPYLIVRHHGQKTFAFDALDQEDQTVSAVLKALGLVLLACGAIALVVGGVNIMNAQLVTVAERTREFGLRRAIGASAAALRTHVILESLTLSISGGILGIIFGLIGAWGVSALLSRFIGAWPFFSVPWAIGLALTAAAGVGVIAGWLPAARAARLEPAVCLREQ